MGQTKEIDLRRLGSALLKKVWLIILCAGIVAGSVFYYSKNFVPKQYRSTVSIYVTNRSDNTGDSQNNFISSSDLATSQRLVTTYINILQSDRVLKKVAENVGLKISPAELRGMITAESPDETEVLYISVTTKEDKWLATKIANAIVDVAPQEIMEIVVGSTAKPVDKAESAGALSAPNSTSNALIGGVIGAVFAVVGISLQVLLDVRIKDEEDLARLCDAPVLGNIPDFNTQGKGGINPYSTNESMDRAGGV